MIYDWYKIFSLTDFVATGLVARTLVVLLETRGRTTFNLFVGENVCVLYDDAFIPVPAVGVTAPQEEYALYTDADNNVWFGFEVPEE